MSKKELYRTLIQVEVLSDRPYTPDSLVEVGHEITNGDFSGTWNITKQERLTPQQMFAAMQNQTSDPAFILGHEFEDGLPCIGVEYDPEFFGGDYSGVGQKVYLPLGYVEDFESVEKAFEDYTGLAAAHIVHYIRDELYDKNGVLFDSDNKVAPAVTWEP